MQTKIVLTSSAYLSIQGQSTYYIPLRPFIPTYQVLHLHAPTDLNITSYNGTATKLAWGPPPDAQSPSLLSYAVVISNGSGALVYNETVREPQLVITTPDPCDHYEATVTPMCGSITGAQTSPVKLGGEYIPLYIVVYLTVAFH